MKKSLFAAILMIFITIAHGQDKVYAPVLVSPANNVTNQMVSTLLDWSAVAGALSYELQYDSDSLFSAPTKLFTLLSAGYTSELKFVTEYFWRVRAIGNPGDTSVWSVVRRFTVKDKPVLVLPVSGISNFHLLPKIKWQPINGCSFHLEYDTLADFSSQMDTMISVLADSLILNIGYYGQEFFFRVRAFHAADTSDWSDVVSVTTREELPLKLPADAIVDASPIEKLEFKGVVGSMFYQYQYSIHSNFSNGTVINVPLSSQIISAGSNADTIVRVLFADTLPYGQTLYWRARAISSVDTSVWSVNPFTIHVIADVKMLFSPAASATGVSTKPTFKWKKIPGSLGYDLEYSTDPNFVSIDTLIQVPHPTSNHDTVSYTVFPPGINISTQYYWRVRAYNNRAVSQWLGSNFTTGNNTAIPEVSLSEALSIYPNPTKGKVNVKLTLPASQEYIIKITNLIGQTIITESGTFNAGRNVLNINLEELNNGIYFISVHTGSQSVMHKIILDK